MRRGGGNGKIKWARVVYVACFGNFAAFLMQPHSSRENAKERNGSACQDA